MAYTDERPDGLISQTFSFRTLAKPQAESPDDNDRIYVLPFNLSWSSSPNVHKYRIIISQNRDLGNPVVNITRSDNYCELNTYSEITYGENYFWRVYAIDSNDQYYPEYASATRAFNVFGKSEPIFPEHKATMPNGGFSLQWEPVENGVDYRLQIRKTRIVNNSFIDFEIFIDRIIEGATEFPFDEFSLSDGWHYYWSVAPVDSGGKVGTSFTERQFNIKDAVRLTQIYPVIPVSADNDGAFFRDSMEDRMIVFKDHIYFVAYDGEWGIYKTDGIPGSYSRIGTYAFPDELTIMNNSLYFHAKPADYSGSSMLDAETGLYRINDPTTDDIREVAPFAAELPGYEGDKNSLVPYDNFDNHRLFFTVNKYYGRNSTDNRRTIWYTIRGEQANTHEVEFNDTISKPYSLPLKAFPLSDGGGRLLFSTYDHSWLGDTSQDLWASDFPFQTATRLTREGIGPWSPHPIMGQLDNIQLFFAFDKPNWSDETRKQHLWRSDGTPEGTSIIATIKNLGTSFVKKSGNYYFWAQDPVNSITGLWRTDGTSAGTYALTLASTGDYIRPAGSTYLAILGDFLYFRYNADSEVENELYRCNGDCDTLEIVADVPSTVEGSMNHGSSYRGFVVALNNRIYYDCVVSFGYEHYWELPEQNDRLCIYDPTLNGTYRVTAYEDGIEANHPNNVGIPVMLNGNVFYAARLWTVGRELWRHTP